MSERGVAEDAAMGSGERVDVHSPCLPPKKISCLPPKNIFPIDVGDEVSTYTLGDCVVIGVNVEHDGSRYVAGRRMAYIRTGHGEVVGITEAFCGVLVKAGRINVRWHRR